MRNDGLVESLTDRSHANENREDSRSERDGAFHGLCRSTRVDTGCPFTRPRVNLRTPMSRIERGPIRISKTHGNGAAKHMQQQAWEAGDESETGRTSCPREGELGETDAANDPVFRP